MENPSCLDMKAGKKALRPNLAWVRALESGGGPRYRQIARQVVGAVNDGILRAGDRLPPQRELAQLLGVDLTTVTKAYAELRQLGMLHVQGASGSYIATRTSEAEVGENAIDRNMNVPPQLSSSIATRMFRVASTNATHRAVSNALMSYHTGAGGKLDRDTAAVWLKPVLGKIDAQQIVVCSGAQSALAALLLTQTREGDTVLAEQLTYPGLIAAARLFRRNVAAVAADAQGMRPDSLEAACMKHRPNLIYLTPTVNNPTATTMSEQRRRNVYAIACRYGVGIVEDDPYWLLAGDAPPPIATHASKSTDSPVFYISTLSKCLSPGLRTAYLVVPSTRSIAPVVDALRCMALMPCAWMTAMATQLIKSGDAREVLGLIRAELAARQELAASILPDANVGHVHGLHRWLLLPSHCDQHLLVKSAREQGLDATPSYAFSIGDTGPNAMRISLGGAMGREVLESALRGFAMVLGERRT